MLKVDLHTHTADDPHDAIPHTAEDLIDRAADLGFDALAITLHDSQLESAALRAYARRRGIVLVPGTERTIEGRHVLLLGFPAGEAEGVRTLDDLAGLGRRRRGLVIAPHPFHPGPMCLRHLMDRHADLFDAVEFSFFYTRAWDLNRRATDWARARGLPLVGNADVHRLWTLGRTFSLVDAAPDPQAICAAIRAGRVEVRTTPLTTWEAAGLLASLSIGDGRAALARAGARLRHKLPGPGVTPASQGLDR